jgi:hypothetical protein
MIINEQGRGHVVGFMFLMKRLQCCSKAAATRIVRQGAVGSSSYSTMAGLAAPRNLAHGLIQALQHHTAHAQTSSPYSSSESREPSQMVQIPPISCSLHVPYPPSCGLVSSAIF